MPDSSLRDGLRAAADREDDFHPKKTNGGPITAWQRRADTLLQHADRIEQLEQKVAALPFPFGGAL